MALIETLLAEISDPDLRARLEREVRELKRGTDFGLVFERHIPEGVLLPPSVGLEVGTEVKLRQEPSDRRRHCQEIPSTTAPPTNGPRATPGPLIPPQIPRATPRRPGGNASPVIRSTANASVYASTVHSSDSIEPPKVGSDRGAGLRPRRGCRGRS
jgi:hypothetical protein